MYRNKLVYLIFVIIILSFLKVEFPTQHGLATKESVVIPKMKLQETGLKLDLYANQSYITNGDAINITYGVYNSNFTIISGIKITFVFDTTIFYKYSEVNLVRFSLKINQTYATVKLLGAIDTDQQAIEFFNVDQKPICVSSCISGTMSVGQLQVYKDYEGIFQIAIQTNLQWYQATDVLEVKLVENNIVTYFNKTNVDFGGYENNYTMKFVVKFKSPTLLPGTYSFKFSFYSERFNQFTVTKQYLVTSSNIGVKLQNTEINRLNLGEEVHDYITYDFDFDITNFYFNYFIANNNSVIYTQQGVVENIVVKLPIVVEYYHDLGEYSINLELKKDGVVLYTKLTTINVYDNIITDFLFTNELTDNQLTIDFQVTTYLEDVLVNIPTNVTIRNNQSNELLKSINVYTTNYFNLTFENASSIPKMLSVETTTNNSLFRGGIGYYPIYYREQTIIGTNYQESIVVERLQNLQLQMQVNKTKTNQSVTDGGLELSVDSKKISQINLQEGNVLSFIIPIDYTVGLHELQLNYLGTDSLRPSSVTYDLVVYSNVHFSDVKVNNTFTNPNTPILIEGFVLDENETPILTKISIIDNSEEIIDQTTTDTNGKFSFIIINTDVLGYYNYKLRAETVNYYKTAEYLFNLLQNNDFTVTITANETMKLATITVKGDIQGTYALRYFTDITKDYPLKILNLDDKGEIETTFLTPNVIGPIYFNITNTKDSTQTWIKKIILYKTPTVSINQESDAYVGEKLNITINSDVHYRLFFNDKLLSNQYLYINKTTLSVDMETKGINNLKLVFQSEYITLDEKLYEIFVYEKVILKQNIPEKINENTNITTYLQIVNKNDIPLGNVEVEFLYQKQVLFHKKTDNKGELLAVISINDLLEKYFFKIVGNQEQYIKEQVFSIHSVLIRSLKLVSNIEEKYFSDLTKTEVKFKLMFKNTDEPAPQVNMSIEILDEGQKKDIYHITSDQNGEMVLDVKKTAGKYILTVITEDPNYIMSKSVYEFTVEKFDVVDNPFFVPTLFMSGAGILVFLRKKISK